MSAKRVFNTVVRGAIKLFGGGGLMQDANVPMGERYVTSGIKELIRSTGAEGAVLLKNDGVLPLKKGSKIALFGRCQYDYFFVGYGSGGDVKPPYTVSPVEAFENAEKEDKVIINRTLSSEYKKWREISKNKIDEGFWGHWPMNFEEMPIRADLLTKVAKECETAVVLIGRAAGEDRENTLKKGSYYLTDTETEMLDRVTKEFHKTVVVLDCGNVIDMSWTVNYGDKLSAVVYAWQGGMESGNAIVDLLVGETNFSGKLADTIAHSYDYYPSSNNFGGKNFNCYEEDIFVGYRYFETFAPQKVLFPFGFGLSYTNFEISVENFAKTDSGVEIVTKVTNTGDRAGKETVQLYLCAPQGKLGKAKRVLLDFYKTPLLEPNESVTVTLKADTYSLCSYDDSGVTSFNHAYVLEKGEYAFYVGNSVKADMLAGEFEQEATVAFKHMKAICGPSDAFERMTAKADGAGVSCARERVPLKDYDSRERILSSLPPAYGCGGEKGINFSDVANGLSSIDDFVSQLSDNELEALTRGYGAMNAPQGAVGNAGAYGGIIPSLQKRGVPAVITTDGPAGIRLCYFTSLLPCGTAQACTWNTELINDLYEKVGEEMVHYGSDVLLGPGMNIHRNPLCGRNFEYFSEDSYLSGKMACAFVNGVQKNGRGACPKHFACNNQEVRRNRNDSRVSERALREIYLKGFEICIKESNPVNIMTSYNKINGVWSHYNFDLATVVLREEWKYEGLIITDWWMQKSASPEFPTIADNAYRVRAGVDVLMPGNMSRVGGGYHSDGTLLKTLGTREGITRGEIERSAKSVLKTVIKLKMPVNK